MLIFGNLIFWFLISAMQLCMSSVLPLAIIICYASSVIERWTVFICCKHVWKSLILHGLISEAEILFFSLSHTHKHIYMYHKVKIHGDTSVLRKKKSKRIFFLGGRGGKSIRFFLEKWREMSVFILYEKYLPLPATL